MSLRLGYMIPEFPGQTHIFFWREISALRCMGEDVFLVSTRRPSPMTCRHEFAAAAAAETHYVFPPSLTLSTSPIIVDGSLARALEYLDQLEAVGLRSRLRRYMLLASAVDLVRWAWRKQIDHIHVQSCADAAHVVAMARHMGGPPYSLALHGDLEVYGTDHRSKMRGAAFVRVVGSHLRDQVMERVGIATDRILVSCMGLDTSKPALLGRHRSYTPGKLDIVTVARLHPSKGHLHALAAICRGVQAGLNLNYTIAGEGQFRNVIESRTDELGLRGRVTLAGSLSETEVFQLLSRADAFLLPSTGLGEAWPVSVMEAMAAALPVIASEIGATPEMITPEEDGFLVPQGDETAVLNKITQLANNVDLRKRIGGEARRVAQQRFDLTMTAAALRDAVLASRTAI